MAPVTRRSKFAGQNPLVTFGGILTTEFLEPQPGRGFCFRQTYQPTDNPSDWDKDTQRLLASGVKPNGPPPHLHRSSDEFFKVEEGVMGINLSGKLLKMTPEDPELMIPANTWHGFFRHPDSEGPMTVVISATVSVRDSALDRLFFENWYGLWHDALMYSGKLNYIEQLQLFDAGDVYMPLPRWVPFPKMSSFVWQVLAGRYLGKLLGYKPFHEEYTTDWKYASEKMV